MRIPNSGIRIDEASFPLLQGLISYWGVTSAAGGADGKSFVCADLVNHASLDGHVVKFIAGPAAGPGKPIRVYGATCYVETPFLNAAGAVQQIVAGTPFVILTALGGGGGPGPAPEEGLTYYGIVDAIGANQFTINSLAGLGAGKFNGVNNPYFAFVLRDAGGAADPPQGEQQPITGYVTATGTFTTIAFTAAVAVGDEILIVSPYFAAMGLLYGQRSGALAYMGQCAVGMAPSNNVMNCPNLFGLPDQAFTRGYQMIVLRNANAPGNPPEMEMRQITNFGAGIFATSAFSADVEENDILLIIHNSVAVQISAYGIADAGSGAGIVRDAARTEADNWWNGQTVMMLSGAARGQKRPIADFIAATDDIIPASNFDAAVAAGDLYVILAQDSSSAGLPNVQEVVIYPVALAADVRELSDAGANPDYFPVPAASTQVNNPAAPAVAWQQAINFEQTGTITVISIFAELEWQSRFVAGGGIGANSISKIQISRDGGVNFVDVTDDFTNPAAVMAGRIRAGVGVWIPTIVAGVDQLVLRLVHFTDDANGLDSSECSIRSNSYLRLTYRKS